MRRVGRARQRGRRRLWRRLSYSYSVPLKISQTAPPAKQAQADPIPQAAPEAGLTLIECLVSITTVALAGALVGPPLLLAAAAQLQAQRIQQAQHLAQAEIDRVRSLVRQASTSGLDLSSLPPVSAAGDPAQQPPPQAIAALRSTHAHCQTEDLAPVEVTGVDVDGDAACDPEFLVQVFRQGGPSASNEAAPFGVTVRVYAASKAVDLQTEIAPMRLGQGMTRRPLAIATATIAPSDAPAALLCYHAQGCRE